MFRFKLALALGMTVGELERRLTAREFAEWIEFYRVHPFVTERVDLMGGIVASTIANVNRGKGSRPLKPSDFMPTYDDRPQQMTDDEMMVMFEAFAHAHNGALKNG